MSAMTNFYYYEKLIQYGRKKTHSKSNELGLEYCIYLGFLDQRGLATDAGKNLMKFIDQSLIVQQEELALT